MQSSHTHIGHFINYKRTLKACLKRFRLVKNMPLEKNQSSVKNYEIKFAGENIFNDFKKMSFWYCNNFEINFLVPLPTITPHQLKTYLLRFDKLRLFGQERRCIV